MSFISSLQDLKKKYGQNPSPTGGTATSTVTQAGPVAVTVTAVEVQEVLIDGYPIDAALSEAHEFPAEVTSYPREKGAEATDHVRVKPLKISLDCVVSDTPIGKIAADKSRTKDASLPSGTIYQRLLKLRESGEPITVSTSLDVYDDMVLSDLSIPRDSGEPHQLHFKAEFIQAQIVENQRTTVRTAKPSGQGKKSLGPRLSQLDGPYKFVFTLPKGHPTALALTSTGSQQPLLIEKNGDQHFQWVDDSPFPRDGWIDTIPSGNPTYHPLKDVSYDPATGIMRNRLGDIVELAPPATMGVSDRQKVIDNDRPEVWNNLANGKSVSPLVIPQVVPR